MDRRDFIRMASWAGLTCVLPSAMDPLRSSAQSITGSAYTGTYWIFMHAGGGWDPTHLCDPKGRATENEDGADVNVQIPSSVVDALLSGEGEELNFRAAIEALAAEGEGELVTVNDDDDRVRVWVDHIAEAE